MASTPNIALAGVVSVQGPMARNVEDLALMLDAMSGDAKDKCVANAKAKFGK